MGTTFDSRQALTAMNAVLTAYTSATGVSTATFAASIASQVSADTSLGGYEKVVLTQISTGLGIVTPSTAVHVGLAFNIEPRTVFGAIGSALTAWSSASSVTTGNFATQLSSVITADAGLSTVESALVTLFTSAIGTATPTLPLHNAANLDDLQVITWFSAVMRALCLTHASGTTTDATQLVTSCANMVTADTGLTSQEKTLVTSISSAINSTTPSSSIHFGKL